MPSGFSSFLLMNEYPSKLNVLLRWETFKACLRGTFIAEFNVVKHNSFILLEQVEGQVRQLELSYVLDPSDSKRETWMLAQDRLDCLSSSAEEWKSFSRT